MMASQIRFKETMMKKISMFVLLLISFATMGSSMNDTKEFDASFTHTVFFWLKNPDNSSDRIAFETALKKFLANSEYAKTNFIGVPPQATRGVVDGSFTYSLIVTFESAEAQQAYQDEIPHKVFIEEAQGLWEKVIVYDATGI